MKKMAILVIILMVVGVGLISGCTNQPTTNNNEQTTDTTSQYVTELADGSPVTGDVDKLKMSTLYSIKSYDNVMDDSDNPAIPYSTYKSKYTQKELDEFYDNRIPGYIYPSKFDTTADHYVLEGSVQNIAGAMLDKVVVTIRIYDDNWNYQEEHDITTTSLPPGQTWTFSLRLENNFNPYTSPTYPPYAGLAFEVIAE